MSLLSVYGFKLKTAVMLEDSQALPREDFVTRF